MTLSWGFVHDWLEDDYYANLRFAQWRVKLGVEWDPFNEAGIWASLHDHGDTTDIALGEGQPFTTVNYQPLAQGSLYWRHVWYNAATTTTWIGVAQEPGNLVCGADARIPLTCRLSLVGDFSYIQPRGHGIAGQFDEMWNVSFGVEFVPGGLNHVMGYRFAPMLPVADNGNFAVRIPN